MLKSDDALESNSPRTFFNAPQELQGGVLKGPQQVIRSDAMWDERYADGWAYGTQPNDFLREHAGRIVSGPVLCLAEGQGRNAVYLAAQGLSVTAVDSSAVGLEGAARLARERGVAVETEVADLADWDLGEARWGAIVSVFCHLPPKVRARVLGAVAESLVPGGLFLLEAYTPAQAPRSTGGPPDPELCVDLAVLRAELPGLLWDLSAELEREVQEGRYHTGLASVVQLIARKPA